MREFEVERARPEVERPVQAEPASSSRAPWAEAQGARTQDPHRPDAGRPETHHLDTRAVMALQRSAGNAAVAQLLSDDGGERSPVAEVVGSGGGAPLEPALRTNMESAFGTSFSDVRVHTDGNASRSAESVGANAYTVGSDIVFRQGQFDSGSASGQRTIAHELTHVVQQRAGQVDGTPTGAGYAVSDPGDRFERAASATADAVIAGGGAESVSAGTPSGATAQRETPEQDEDQLGG